MDITDSSYKLAPNTTMKITYLTLANRQELSAGTTLIHQRQKSNKSNTEEVE